MAMPHDFDPDALLTLLAVSAVFSLAACIGRAVFRRGCGCLRRASSDIDEEQFFSCESGGPDPCGPRTPLLAGHRSDEGDLAFTAAESAAVASISAQLSMEQPGTRLSEKRLLQIAWSRQLDVTAAVNLYKRHLDCVRRLGVGSVPDAEVREAYESQNFCVSAGPDHEGRPICWVRLNQTIPARIRAATCVRNTWMAQDFLLNRGGVAANRAGICFVYDTLGVGLQNITTDPLWIRASLWGGPSHPSHISRVWILDPPSIFVMAWNAFKHLLPAYLREVVIFQATSRGRRASSQEPPDEGLARICPRESLPVYLGGDPARFPEAFVDAMFRGLEGQDLPYTGSEMCSAEDDLARTKADLSIDLPPDEEGRSFGVAGRSVLRLLEAARRQEPVRA